MPLFFKDVRNTLECASVDSTRNQEESDSVRKNRLGTRNKMFSYKIQCLRKSSLKIYQTTGQFLTKHVRNLFSRK